MSASEHAREGALQTYRTFFTGGDSEREHVWLALVLAARLGPKYQHRGGVIRWMQPTVI